ncbi:MAG: hypothetical protein WB770_08930, partial [Acidimicrobiales bacterium]
MSRRALLEGSTGPSLALRVALGATLVIAGVAALIAPSASAANREAKNSAASVAHFHVTGIVSAANANTVNLFVEQGVVAGRSVRHDELSVHVDRARIHEFTTRRSNLRHRGRPFSVGEIARLSGNVFEDGSSDDLEAQSATVSSTPMMAIVGQVTEVGGTLVIVDRTAFGEGDHMSDYVEPAIVDDSQATVTLDGAAATASQIAAGQTVVVLGTSANDIVLAAAIYAFSTPPTIAKGILQTVSGDTLAIWTPGYRDDSYSWGQGDENAMFTGTPILVDASSATIVLNGVT